MFLSSEFRKNPKQEFMYSHIAPCLTLFSALPIVCLLQHKTIDSVLERGEKLDTLVEKSSDLSAASQVLQMIDLVIGCLSCSRWCFMNKSRHAK